MSIPKIIHLIDPAHNVLSVWQNTHPDWQCIEWSIEGCYAFLKRYYPESEASFLQLTTSAQRIHMAWYYLLHRYGGVAIEGNRVPKKKIEALFMSLYDLYLIEDWFIASAPGTPFLEDAIETLPTLQSKWYSRFLGERALVRDTATVVPDTPYKRHPYRVYHNYFQPLHATRMSLWRIFLIVLLLFIVFQLVRITIKKNKLKLSAQASDIVEESVLENSNDSSILPSLDVLKGISLESLEKRLNLPSVRKVESPASLVISPLSDMSDLSEMLKGVTPRGGMLPPKIRIPPLDPPTPSSISDDSLVITPLGSELEITF